MKKRESIKVEVQGFVAKKMGRLMEVKRKMYEERERGRKLQRERVTLW